MLIRMYSRVGEMSVYSSFMGCFLKDHRRQHKDRNQRERDRHCDHECYVGFRVEKRLDGEFVNFNFVSHL